MSKPTLQELRRELANLESLVRDGGGFQDLIEIEEAENLRIAIAKEEYKARRNYKTARGFFDSPEYKRTNKSNLQRRRRFKSRQLELLASKQITVQPLQELYDLPFWAAYWPSRANEIIQMIDNRAGTYKDFVAQVSEVEKVKGKLVEVSRVQENTEFGLFRLMASRYNKYESSKVNTSKRKRKSLGVYFPTDVILYQIDDLLILDIETTINM